MNEPVAVEPQPARGDDSRRAAAPAGFGYALAQARVRAGLSVDQAAARIRLHPRQLQAIENEDLQSLPAAAYVNGFVRNYARELGIDASPLIDDLNAKLKLRGLSAPEPDLGPSAAVHAPLLDERTWRHLVLAAIVIALICAGLIGAWMAHSSGRHDEGFDARVPDHSAEPAGATQAATSSNAAAPSALGSEPAGGTDAGPQGFTPPTLGSGVSGTNPSVSAPGAPGAISSANAGPALAAAPAAPAAASTEAEGNPAAAGATSIPVATLAPSPGATTGLLLRFTERSWVEVSQPDGRVLLSRIGEPGSIETVNASAPLVLVVGRADAVIVEFRGQLVNLKPYVNSTNGVARVLLADSDGANGGQSNR